MAAAKNGPYNTSGGRCGLECQDEHSSTPWYQPSYSTKGGNGLPSHNYSSYYALPRSRVAGRCKSSQIGRRRWLLPWPRSCFPWTGKLSRTFFMSDNNWHCNCILFSLHSLILSHGTRAFSLDNTTLDSLRPVHYATLWNHFMPWGYSCACSVNFCIHTSTTPQSTSRAQ